MAAAKDPKVSECDDDWYTHDVVDIENNAIETNCSSGISDYQGNQPETDDNRAGTSPHFDAVINDLHLHSSRGSAEFDENVTDDISPAIQISKTFSLAALDTSSYCNKSPSIRSDSSPPQSYNLTNLDNENTSADDKNTAPLIDNTIRETHENGSSPDCVDQDDHTKQFLSNNRRKAINTNKPIECHVIDLETISTGCTCSSITAEQNMSSKTCGHSSVKPLSTAIPDPKKYYSQTQTIFLTDDKHTVYSESNQSQPESSYEGGPYFVGDSNTLPPDDVTLRDTNYDDGINSFYFQDEGGDSFGYMCNLEQMRAETTENNDTSDLVIDLDDKLPDDSGIFEVSLTGKNSFSNFTDHQLVVSPTREHVKRTFSTKQIDAPTLDSANKGGGHKELISFLHDTQREEIPRMYQRNTSYNIPHNIKRESNFYNGMTTLRDPYVTGECYTYNQNYNSPFLFNRIFPCSSWESTFPQKNSFNPMITGLADESTQSAWCNESFADFFESRNPPEGVQSSQLSAIKDEEETDDADEVGFIPETSDMSSSQLGQGSGQLSNYFFTENPDVNRYTSTALTPPPSEASTPDPLSSLYNDMPTHQWGPSSTYPFPDYVSHGTSTTVNARQPQHFQPPCTGLKPNYFDSNFLNQGSQRGIARSFPSMADAVYSGYPFSPSKYAGIDTCTRKIDPKTRRRGKPRKSQIQSDKISTSTPKNLNGNPDKAEPITCFNFANQASEIQTKTKPLTRQGRTTVINRIPRHNEPLKQYAVDVMTKWYEENIHNPYPTKAQKTAMAQEGQISENQVKSWFANKRNRTHNTKPKVQKRAMEEKLKELFKDLKNNNPTTPTDNNHIIQQLSGIIKHCHMKLD